MNTIRNTARFLLPAILVLASGCGDAAEEGAAEAGGEPQRGGTAVLVEQADMTTPMPLLLNTEFEGGLQDMMFMSLLGASWGDGEIAFETSETDPMALARGYEYLGADSSALRFHLRSDVRWSDGQPITAGDVVWTYEMLRDPAVESPRQDYPQRMDSVVAQNDSTVTFYFQSRYPEMLFHTGHAIVPKHVYEGADPAQIRSHPSVTDPAGGNLVVSGPFQVGRWVRGQQITLVPNPHFRPQPNLEQVVFRIVPDPTTRLVELETGAVDFVKSVSTDQIPGLKSRAPSVRLEQQEKRFYDYVAYNPSGFAAFADPEIRRALGLAMDVREMVRALDLEEYAVAAGGPYPPIFRDLYDAEEMSPLPHDPERARQILESKGWRDSDGDGIREKGGQPFRFTMITNAGSQRRGDAMQMIQQQWREIGVDAQLQQIEFGTLMQKITGRDFQAALAGWQVSLSPDLTGLWGEETPLNITGYDNPEVASLFEQAKSQKSPEAAAPYWREAASIMAEDQPYTWLYFVDGVHAVRDRLQNMKIDTYGPYQNAWEWWVRDGEATSTATASR